MRLVSFLWQRLPCPIGQVATAFMIASFARRTDRSPIRQK